ncbi:hypothetical protein FHX74_002698 [Friedmanniella endophytica]|uniref:PAC2 family protein n=1 Tax=Microlunatus kandeliicorticis TaxID=1759536 RepID=A0A7W3ITV5_9ACTN|nr:PAC2 family protein [Microlunatus kandeliicorticis]MBA8795070.1 hypothetical protein [Microlunatus kandeliicorticis]
MADEWSGGDLRNLTDPLVVVAFGGWNDAGSSASQAVEHLAETYDARPAFSLDPDDYYDFQVSRPKVRSTEDGDREIVWPTTELRVARLPQGRDLVLVSGLEPNFHWRRFTTALVSAVRSTGARQAMVLGALLADHPHTRPIPVTATSANPDLARRHGLTESTYEGPTGIVGVVGDALDRAGLEVVSLWASIPHYVSHSPCPKGTLALLARVEDLLDLTLDVGDLPELARAWERGVDELAAEDAEVAEYVSSLEHQRDATELPEASGDAIAAEFERYLRRRGPNA